MCVQVVVSVLVSHFEEHLLGDLPGDPTETSSIYRRVAKLTGVSSKTLKTLWKSYKADDKLLSPQKRGRKKCSATQVYHAKNFDVAHLVKVEDFVKLLNNEKGGGVTLKKLKDLFLSECNLLVPESVIRRVLLRLGYQWGASKKIGQLKKSKDRKLRIRQFLRELAEARRLESQGTHIIVYTDETYCHQRHSPNYTWFHPNHDEKNTVFTGSGKGQRLIILHAISKDGLLYSPGHERVKGKWVRVVQHRNLKLVFHADRTWQLTEEAKSAEWVFVGKVKKEDYHKNMNGDNFMAWVEKRLLPAFLDLYPVGLCWGVVDFFVEVIVVAVTLFVTLLHAFVLDKKMILVLDNAPYHHCRDENFINPEAMKRTQLIDSLLGLAQQNSMDIERDNATLPISLREIRNSKRGGKKSPTVVELRAELQKYLDQHPEYQQGRLKRLFDGRGYVLIFTPPYTPKVQPSEMTWSFVKHSVAAGYERGRTIHQTIDQVLPALRTFFFVLI